MLAANGLACRRGGRLLFKGMDVALDAGQLLWVRGQNGCGKTSLLRLLAGLSTPEHGEIRRGGLTAAQDAAPVPRIVFIAHANALKDDLSASEALAFLLRIHGLPCDTERVSAALDRLGMPGRRHALVRTLSQGQRRRVALARLAVEDTPSMWLLDEPFDALDAEGIERVNGLLAGHLQRGGSVLLSSHVAVSSSLHPVEFDLDRVA